VTFRVPVRPAVKAMAPYNSPAEGRAGKLRLDFNENTDGCSPRVLRALARLTREKVATYPEYQATPRRLASFFRVSPEQLLLTNGIDDALRLIVETFVDPGCAVVIVEPTFTMYRFYADMAGARIQALEYDDLVRFPIKRAVKVLRPRGSASGAPRVLFVANPNNPTGTLVPRDTLRRLLEASRRTLVVVDEAYFEFSGLTVLSWIRRYEHLVVSRTFSKAAGLAGLRLGCLFAQKHVIELLRRVASPFAVNAAALVAAEAAIEDRDFTRNYVREVKRSRAVLEEALVELGIRICPSAANLVLADLGPRAPRLVKSLERRGILLRYNPGNIRGVGFVRITVGKLPQTRRLIRELKKLW
jgi:histidinol-phosphate aminotransferase